jgi:beta-galactosidase
MKPVRLDKDYFIKNGRKFILVGINYMPSKAFYRLWEDWNPNQIEKDFKKIKELNLEAIRVPLFWASVEPEEGVISPKFLKRFDEFLEIAKKHEIYVMPFLFVGVCVDIWDVPWRHGRNIYKDSGMLKLERKHAETLAARYVDHPAILAWDISDEPYYYGGNTDADTAANWVSLIYDAIKSRDKKHPVTLGFDNCHIIRNTGFQIERLIPTQDFFSLCAYPIYSLKTPETHTSMRSTYFTSFFIKFSQLGKPVLLSEGPGTTTVWTSSQGAANYYRVVTYSSFINGSIGIMPWILYDYHPKHHKGFPLDDKPFETSFGVLQSDGKEKLPAKELRKFSKLIKKIDLEKFRFRKPEAALLIPKDYYKHVETVWPRLFEAFILSKEAHMEVDFLREGEALSDYKIVIVPSSLVLRTSSWYAFKDYVSRGGCLYFSYGGALIGSPNPLGPFFNEIFGVSLQDRTAPMPSEKLTFTDWMNLNQLKLTYPDTAKTSCIELKTDSGHVVGFDSRRNPAIVVNRKKNKNSAILVTHPIEQYLSVIPDAYCKDQTYKLYDAIRTGAELVAPYTCDNPFIEASWMETEDKDEAVLILINHERTDARAIVSLKGIWQAQNLVKGEKPPVKNGTGKTYMNLSFAPSEVKILVLKLTGSNRGHRRATRNW